MGGKKQEPKGQPQGAPQQLGGDKAKSGSKNKKAPATAPEAAQGANANAKNISKNNNIKASNLTGNAAPPSKSKKQLAEERRRAAEEQKAQRDAVWDNMLNPACEDLSEGTSDEDESAALQPERKAGNSDKIGKFSPAKRATEDDTSAGDGARSCKNFSSSASADRKLVDVMIAADAGAAEDEVAKSSQRLRRQGLQNEEIDVAKQYEAAKAELEKLQKKAETNAKGLSNKDKRSLEKLTQKVAELEEDARRDQESKSCPILDDSVPDTRLLAEKYSEKLRPFHFSIADEATAASQSTDLIIDRFSISVKGQKLFDDAPLKLVQGRRYGLLGPNGRGKSTLLLHLAAGKFPMPSTWSCILVEQEVAASSRSCVEEVLFADQELQKWRREEADLFAQLAVIENDGVEAAGLLGDDPVAAAKALEALVDRAQEVSSNLTEKESAESEVRRILAGLGFSEEGMEAATENFSGGWRMRIALAKGLFLKPKLLLLDEPTNHLDLEAACWLEDYLASYPHTLLTVSHDAEFLDQVCTDMVALVPETGKLLYARGSYNSYKQKKEQERAAALKEYKKSGQRKDLKPRPDYVVNFSFPEVDDVAHHGSASSWISAQDVSFGFSAASPAAAEASAPAGNEGTRASRDISTSSKPMSKRLHTGPGTDPSSSSSGGDDALLFKDLSLRVDESSRIALVGPNGCGKSTLLRLLMKMQVEPQDGFVEHSKQLRVGYYSQHFEELLPLRKKAAVGSSTTATKGASGGISACEFFVQQFQLSEQKARATLGSFGLQSAQHLIPMTELSGGQKARVCFAKITLQKPRLLIFDEPTNHLDLESVEALMEALETYSGGVVLVSHDARLVRSVTNVEHASCAPGTVYKVEREGLVEISYSRYVRQVLNEIELRAQASQARAQKKQAEAEEKRKQKLRSVQNKYKAGGSKKI
ncbi:unnamed protein product [Amoebophrya sp. A120]|nr:unnamed protein product [Amoebophrya sp. A120]|eukprot:GSA120T00015087001.1